MPDLRVETIIKVKSMDLFGLKISICQCFFLNLTR